jgi:integrase
MRGSIVRRGAKWAVIVDVGRDATGRRKQRWHSGYETKRDASRALTDILAGLQAGAYVEPSKQTVAAFLDEWIDGVRATLRPSTWASYKLNVERHIIPGIGSVPLQQLTPTRINSLYAHLLASGRSDGKGGLSPRTVKYIAIILKRALSEAVRWQQLIRNPADAAQSPRPAHAAEMKTWNGDELHRFLRHVESDPLYPAYLFSATCGTRRGETLGLRWRDVDLAAGRVSITQTLLAIAYRLQFSTPKTAKGRRMISMDATTVAALREHRRRQLEARLAFGSGYRDDLDLVFARADGSPIHPERLTRAFEAQLRKAALPHIRLHDLRHTCASLMLAAGVPAKVASERLGHSSIGITLDTYSHVLPGLQEDAAEKLAAAVFGR